MLRDVYLLAVDAHVDTAEETHVEARGSNNDISVEFVSAVEFDAVGNNALDGVGDDVCFSAAEGFEVVAVGTEAHALLPRVVAGFEVRVNGEIGGQLLSGFLDEEVGCEGREPDAEFVEEDGDEGEHEAWGC